MAKMLGEGHSTESDPPEQESSDDPSCEELAQMLDADLTETDIQEWTEADSNDPGHQLYTDEEIIFSSNGIRGIVLRRRGRRRGGRRVTSVCL